MLWSKAIKKSILLELLTNISFTIIIYIVRNLIHYRKTNNKVMAIIALRKLGDAVFTIPAVKQIQKKSEGKLFLICFPETEPIFRTALSNIEIVVLRHDQYYLNDRIAKTSARKLLAGLLPGTIIDLTGVITSATLIYSSNAENIIGANEKYFHAIYSDYIHNSVSMHMIDHYLNIVNNYLGLPEGSSIKEFPCEIKENGCILIHPYAGWEAKEWNLPKFISLAKNLKNSYDCTVVVPDESKKEYLIEQLKNTGIESMSTKSIDELITVINGCSVFISNDSGPLQIAALLGKPTFTIYGPTNPEYHLPFGKNHSFVQKIIECSPREGEKFCFTNAGRYGCPSFECMNLLSVEEVTGKVLDFISSLNIEK